MTVCSVQQCETKGDARYQGINCKIQLSLQSTPLGPVPDPHPRRPRGSQSGREKLKTFFAPFLPTRLTQCHAWSLMIPGWRRIENRGRHIFSTTWRLHLGCSRRAWRGVGIFNMAAAKPWFYTIRKHRKKSIAAALFAGWLTNYGVNKYR